MKKLFLFILLFCTFTLSKAQKEYIWIYATCGTNPPHMVGDGYVCGAITASLENKITSLIKTDSINGYNRYCRISKNGLGLYIDNFNNIGRLLNLLAEDGYEIEQVQGVADSYVIVYIMSRQKSTQTSESTKKKKGDVNEDNKVDINDVVAVINIMADDTNAT